MGRLYSWFWWHVEVWVSDTKLRRPFTYIFRDHPWAFVALLVILGIIACLSGTWWVRGPLIALAGLITGHVWWGSRVDRWQQEDPEYNPIEGRSRT